MVVMRSKDNDLYNYVSQLCGTRIYDYTCERHPLITAMDIQTLSKEKGNVFMLLQGCYPFKTALPDIDEYQFDLPEKKLITYRKRYKVDRRQLDLGEIVKDMHKKKINEMINKKPDNPILQRKQDVKVVKSPEVNLDIDALIEKIDAKIAELEKEEKKNDNDNS